MRVEEIVGGNIRARREGQEMTQEQLGQRLGELLGHPWSRQAVSIAERGGRGFTAAELIAIAHALGTSVARIFTPARDADGADLPGGIRLSRDELLAAALPQLGNAHLFDEMRDMLSALSQTLRIAVQGSALAAERIESLDKLLEIASERAALQAPTAEDDR